MLHPGVLLPSAPGVYSVLRVPLSFIGVSDIHQGAGSPISQYHACCALVASPLRELLVQSLSNNVSLTVQTLRVLPSSRQFHSRPLLMWDKLIQSLDKHICIIAKDQIAPGLVAQESSYRIWN